MKHRFFIPIALLAAALGGCAKNNQAAMQRPTPIVLDDTTEIELKPLTANTHYAAGLLAESRGDYNSALRQYRAALRLEPKNDRALFRTGCINAQLKKYPEAVATWRRYLTVTDQSATGYSNLAYAEELAGNPIAAETDYKNGIKRDPNNAPCRVNFGLMLARHGRVGEAIVQLQAVLPPSEVHYDLATVYELQHRPEMAKIEYQEAVAQDPNFTDAKQKLATLGDPSDD